MDISETGIPAPDFNRYVDTLSLPLIHSLYLDELTDLCQAAGLPRFRAKQIWHWLYHHHVTAWDSMRNIPPDTRLWLEKTFALPPEIADRRPEHGNQSLETRKILVKLTDGDSVEAVIIPVTRRSPDQKPPTTDHPTNDQRPTDQRPTDQRPTDQRPTDQRPTDQRPTDQRPTDQRPTDQRPTDQRPTDQRPTDQQTTQPDNSIRNTLCISCQVGCRFNCAFCASGKAGLIRNLEAGEMISQIIAAANILGKRPDNVVFMGIGEPFDNYEETLKAARILNDPDGLKIGARKITVSTSGIIPGIERFADEGLQFELSVSLHAPNNAIRSQLMPINNTYPLPQLIEACKKYTENTNRIITFEYTLIRNINDSLDHAYQLAKLLRGFRCRVNLIPLSPIAEFNGRPSTDNASQMFIDTLQNAHINATLRRSQGASLKAACGQLRFSKRTST